MCRTNVQKHPADIIGMDQNSVGRQKALSLHFRELYLVILVLKGWLDGGVTSRKHHALSPLLYCMQGIYTYA